MKGSEKKRQTKAEHSSRVLPLYQRIRLLGNLGGVRAYHIISGICLPFGVPLTICYLFMLFTEDLRPYALSMQFMAGLPLALRIAEFVKLFRPTRGTFTLMKVNLFVFPILSFLLNLGFLSLIENETISSIIVVLLIVQLIYGGLILLYFSQVRFIFDYYPDTSEGAEAFLRDHSVSIARDTGDNATPSDSIFHDNSTYGGREPVNVSPYAQKEEPQKTYVQDPSEYAAPVVSQPAAEEQSVPTVSQSCAEIVAASSVSLPDASETSPVTTPESVSETENTATLTPKNISQKKRFCKRCGGEIIEGVCSQCGHRYFHLKKKSGPWPTRAKLSVIILSVLLAVAIGVSAYGLIDGSRAHREVKSVRGLLENRDRSISSLENKYQSAQKEIDRLEASAEYRHRYTNIKRYVVFIASGKNTYHDFDCEIWKKDLDEIGTYYAHNKEYAKSLGYRPCSSCQ